MTDGLMVERRDGAVWLRLDRPGVGNSLTRAIQEALVAELTAASADDDVRAVVVAASGDRHFCTGPDLSDPELAPNPDRVAGDAARRLRTGSQAVVTAILDCEKPVLCALNGTAAGVGASIVLACDLVIAADTARLIEVFVRRGLAPDGGAAYLLARKVPANVAKELVFFGEELSAAEAHRLGVVNRVVAPDELDTVVGEWAGRLAAGPTRAHAAAKAMLNQALDVGRDTALATEALLVEQVAGTDDVAEGVSAFLDKREARYRGR